MSGQSKGHIAIIGEREYFEREGVLYSAYADRPLDIWGYRLGARFECYAHMIKQCLARKSQDFYRFA